MQKLLLFSTALMLFAIPLVAASDRSARRGLRRAVLALTCFNLFYWFAIRYIYRHL